MSLTHQVLSLLLLFGHLALLPSPTSTNTNSLVSCRCRGMRNCQPIHKQMLPKPCMWALQEGPHQLCCCWTQSHLLRHLMVEKQWKKMRGWCRNRVVVVKVKLKKNSSAFTLWLSVMQAKKSSFCSSCKNVKWKLIHTPDWCCCKKPANPKFKAHLFALHVCMLRPFYLVFLLYPIFASVIACINSVLPPQEHAQCDNVVTQYCFSRGVRVVPASLYVCLLIAKVTAAL